MSQTFIESAEALSVWKVLLSYGERKKEVEEMRWAVLSFIPENTITFSYKRNLWPNTASKLAVQILTYLKQYAPFCPTIFSLSLAPILRLPRKIKTKCIFRFVAFVSEPARDGRHLSTARGPARPLVGKALHSAL